MPQFTRKGSFALFITICVIAITEMGMELKSSSTMQATTHAMVTPVGIQGYDIRLFATGTKQYFGPDSVEVVGNTVYVGYQNGGLPDGSDHVPSTIVAYTLDGHIVHMLNVSGHCDGLRFDPFTNQLWATSNEDANAILTVITPKTGAKKQYAFPTPPLHGGGYDALAFEKGMAFGAASNPPLNSQGVNTAPAVAKIVISNGKLVLTPVLFGNATATDIATGQKVTLDLTDPDSMSIASNGDVVLDSQGDAELVFLHNAGTSNQTVSRLTLGTQVEDTIWIPAAKGRMVIVDSKQNAIYTVAIDKTGFTPGTIYTEAPSDSGVASFVGIVAPKSGTITPVIVGLTSPTGLGFIAG